MGITNNLQIQTLEQNQSNKYLTLNYSLNVIEAVALGTFKGFIDNASTASVGAAGTLWIVTATAGAAFTPHRNKLAYYDGSAISFFPATNALKLRHEETKIEYQFNGTVWTDAGGIDSITQNVLIATQGGYADISLPFRRAFIYSISTSIATRIRFYQSTAIRTSDTVPYGSNATSRFVYDTTQAGNSPNTFFKPTLLISNESTIKGRLLQNIGSNQNVFFTVTFMTL